MNRGPASLHRISVGLLGLLAVLVGVAMILHRTGVQPIAGWIDDFDPSAVTRFVDGGWWTLVLVGIGLAALVWGWSLIASTIRPGRVHDVLLDGSGPEGDLVVPPKAIAQAVDAELEGLPPLTGSSVSAVDDRNRTIIRIVATAKRNRSYEQVLAALAPTLEDLKPAVAGTDVAVQTYIHLE